MNNEMLEEYKELIEDLETYKEAFRIQKERCKKLEADVEYYRGKYHSYINEINRALWKLDEDYEYYKEHSLFTKAFGILLAINTIKREIRGMK